MKVCMVLREYPPNFSGGSVHALELINALDGLGNEVYIVAPANGHKYYVANEMDSSKSEENLHDAKVPCNLYRERIHLVETTPGLAFGSLLSEIEKIDKQEKLDILHIHFLHPLSILALLIKLRDGIPTILTGHGGDLLILSSVSPSDLSTLSVPSSEYNNLVVGGINTADIVITVSKQLKDFCIGELGVAARKVRHVSHGVDFDRFNYRLDGSVIREKHELDANDKVILFSGRLSREKGVEYLIRAMPQIIKSYSKARLLVLGDGPQRGEMIRLTADLGLQGDVKFAGVVPYTEVPLYRAGTDILVLPSINEGTPLSIYETFAMRRPVIATSVGGIPDLINHEFNGLLVEPRNPSMLADAILELLTKEEKYREIAKNGYRYVKDITWQRIARIVSQIYKEAKV